MTEWVASAQTGVPILADVALKIWIRESLVTAFEIELSERVSDDLLEILSTRFDVNRRENN